MVKNKTNHILEFVKTNASQTIINKGRSIIVNKQILKSNIEENSATYEIAEVNNKMYKVEISDYYAKQIDTFCTCEFNWGRICNHQVAALLHLAEHLNKENPDLVVETKTDIYNFAPTKNNREKDGYHIKSFYPLTSELILEHSIKRNSINYFNFINSSEVIDVKKNYAKFKYQRNYNETQIVEFKIINNELIAICNCGFTINKLCQHQTSILELILNKLYDPMFFKNITTEVFDANVKIIYEKYGFENQTEFEKYFTVNYVSGFFKEFPKNLNDNILPFKNIKGIFNLNSIEDAYNQFENYVNQEEESSSENYELGYCFMNISNNQYNSLIILSFAGKTDKARTNNLTKIKEINSDININLNIVNYENNSELLKHCLKVSEIEIRNFISYNKLKDSNEIQIEVNKYIFKNLQTIIPILAETDFVYVPIESNSLSKSNLTKITISKHLPRLEFDLNEDDIFYTLTPYIIVEERKLQLTKNPNLFFFIENNILYFFDNLKLANSVEYFKQIGNLKILKSKKEELFKEVIVPTSQNFVINMNAKSLKPQYKKINSSKKQIYISELGTFVLIKPIFYINDQIKVNILKEGNPVELVNDKPLILKRNTEEENKFIELIKSLHPKLEKQFRTDFFHLAFHDFVKNFWFLKAFDILRADEVEIFGLNSLKRFNYSSHKPSFNIGISSGQDWFDLDVNITFGENRISLKDVQKAVANNDSFVKLGDGTIGILPEEWLKKFEKYFRQGEVKKDSIKISKLKFSIIDELFDNIQAGEVFEEIYEKQRRIKEFEKIENVIVPTEINATLREYQKSGLNWLNFLDQFSWGGILADDMGLGKTLQILAFLELQIKKTNTPNLIVLPTTLIFNWRAEIEKFAPNFNVLYYHGANRNMQDKNFEDYHIIITTYGLVINDIEFFQKHFFNYIILDESQAIKNPTSKRYKAVTLLKSNNKIALTGTPIENNTFDLYAQMNFLNPGFLGSQNSFKTDYSQPIDKDRNTEIAKELQKLISPFVLRRTKEQVAKELPAKTEDYLYCIMDTEQRNVYDAFKNKYRDFLLNKIDSDGIEKSKIYVLEGLLKLRQICDSPELLNEPDNYGDESVKIKELIRHIKEKTANHKILVFSQFVTMLKIIERELIEKDVVYEYLDGQSSQKERENSVNRFQADTKCRVFLISLKAGGVGLNLTAADYVYLVDPWWNPAVENQAIDRCYRIGQDKKVIAYRMICKDTIEEKIMNYQAKKQEIASEIIRTDESFIKQLKKEDIYSLFE